MKQYIIDKLNDIKSNPSGVIERLCSSNSDIKHKWKSEDKHLKWSNIRTNEDVYNLINQYNSIVESVEKDVHADYAEAVYKMMLGLNDALQGLRKLANNIDDIDIIDSIYANFSEVTQEEVDGLFDKVKNIERRMEEQITIIMNRD